MVGAELTRSIAWAYWSNTLSLYSAKPVVDVVPVFQ